MKKFKKISIDDFEKNYNDEIINNINLDLVSNVEEQLKECVNDYYTNIKSSLIDCESPVEQMLAIELENLHLENSYLFNPNLEIIGFEKQYEIECNKNKYRVDFLIPVIFYKNIKRCYIIECDGYEFHQKTKEQVQNDYIRERNIEMCGYKIIKFTGSEIYNNAYNCALEIIKFIKEDFIRIGEEYGYQKNS